MDDELAPFTIGNESFYSLDELKPEVQQVFLEWKEKFIQAAVESYLSQKIGEHNASKITVTVKCTL